MSEDREAKHPTPRVMGVDTASDGRMTSTSTLDDMIRRARLEVTHLEALKASLPRELPQMADEALWNILNRSRPPRY